MKRDAALVAVMDGLDTTSPVEPTGDAQTNEAQASPSYVQSILSPDQARRRARRVKGRRPL